VEECLFCELKTEKILENKTACAFFDKHPVSKGHLLIIPKKHRKDFFHLTEEERKDITLLVQAGKQLLASSYAPDGYNIGFNCGAAAGQTVFHCHCHLIPRYFGDTKEPKGGIRGVIPSHMAY